MPGRIWIVFQKEFIDALRDWRPLLTSLFLSLMPSGTLVAMLFVTSMTYNISAPLEISIVGIDRAPALVAYLKDHGAIVTPVLESTDTLEPSVQEGRNDVVLVIPDSYPSQLDSEHPGSVRILTDSSRSSSLVKVSRLNILMNSYNQMVSLSLLKNKGLNESLLKPVGVQIVDVATPNSQSIIAKFLPFLLIIVAFGSGTHIVFETITGEKEKNSLEPLLINPVDRFELLIGKGLASIPFAAAITAVTFLVTGIVIFFMPALKIPGIVVMLPLDELVAAYLLVLPLIFTCVGIQLFIASLSRSTKEANTVSSFVMMLVSFPGMFSGMAGVNTSVLLMLIPFFGQSLLMTQIMEGKFINPMFIVVSCVMAFVAGIIFLLAGVYFYQGESVIYKK